MARDTLAIRGSTRVSRSHFNALAIVARTEKKPLTRLFDEAIRYYLRNEYPEVYRSLLVETKGRF